MRTIYYETMTQDDLLFDQIETYKVVKDGLEFYFRTHFKSRHHDLVVFSNGAYDPDKKELPIFQRSSWSDDINANCLFIDDLTLHGTGISLGWGIGTKDRHYILDYSAIAIKFRKLLNISSQQTIYYGSSAGGYMSLLLASADKGAMALVNNPQTYVLRYYPAAVEKMLNAIFPDVEREVVHKEYAERLSVTTFFKKMKWVPHTLYIQNMECPSDMKNHYHPFINNLRRYNFNTSRIKYLLYHNKKQGHNPLNRADTLKLINQAIQNKMPL